MDLLFNAYARWASMPPVVVSLERSHAWTVLLALQTSRTHPAMAESVLGKAAEAWGRQLQEGLCDDVEVYAVAERGWARPDPGALAGDDDVASDPAMVRLMSEAYVRWQSMSPVSVTASRQVIWSVMMALQLTVRHPAIGGTRLGPVVESVGRQLQAGLSDDPELYALAEAGWTRAADGGQA